MLTIAHTHKKMLFFKWAFFMWLKYSFSTDPVHRRALLCFRAGTSVCFSNGEHADRCLLKVMHDTLVPQTTPLKKS